MICTVMLAFVLFQVDQCCSDDDRPINVRLSTVMNGYVVNLHSSVAYVVLQVK